MGNKAYSNVKSFVVMSAVGFATLILCSIMLALYQNKLNSFVKVDAVFEGTVKELQTGGNDYDLLEHYSYEYNGKEYNGTRRVLTRLFTKQKETEKILINPDKPTEIEDTQYQRILIIIMIIAGAAMASPLLMILKNQNNNKNSYKESIKHYP